MKTITLQTWFFIRLLFFLAGGLVDSSSLSSALPQPISSQVGQEAVLPCSWKSRLGPVELPACHVEWKNLGETVFEQLGAEKFEAEGFQGRVEVPEEKLGSGDCSLIIRDVQIIDAGRYESFMVVEDVRASRTKVFIQSVRLSVIDHKSHETRAPGEDLVLDLYTPQSKRVVFQGRNSSSWSVLWMRENGDHQRLQRVPEVEQLRMQGVQTSDEGTYKVVDEHGLAVSTVQLSVEENSTSLKRRAELEDQAPTGGAARQTFPALLLSSLLVLTLQMFNLS